MKLIRSVYIVPFVLIPFVSLGAGASQHNSSLSGVKTIAKKTWRTTKRLLSQHVERPLYFGLGLGYGNTNWNQMTTAPGSSNPATQGAPISATGAGFVYSFFSGYQFSEHFTCEFAYTHYPRTRLGFQTTSNNYNLATLDTDTSAWSLQGKLLVPFGFTHAYAYADAGVTIVHRKDITLVPNRSILPPYPFNPLLVGKVNRYKAGASFGFGLAGNLSPRLFLESGFQYTTGYGKADTMPAKDYMPFVYSITLRLGYRVL